MLFDEKYIDYGSFSSVLRDKRDANIRIDVWQCGGGVHNRKTVSSLSRVNFQFQDDLLFQLDQKEYTEIFCELNGSQYR